MRRDELKELHFITPVANVPSILAEGILCHRGAQRLPHASVAMEEIQERRKEKLIPGAGRLHDYANLYLYARNAMLFKCQARHAELCVLRVSVAVLDLPNVVIADQNAASDYVRFRPVPAGLDMIEYKQLFAESWIHAGDDIATWRHKSRKCAEVLVPDRVAPELILGAYVSGGRGRAALLQVAPALPVEVDGYLFFQGRNP